MKKRKEEVGGRRNGRIGRNRERKRRENAPRHSRSFLSLHPSPQVGEGPIEPCVGLGLHLPQAQNKEDTCLFPSRGIRGTERCFYFVFSSNPVHGHNRPKTFYVQELLQCMAHVAWLVIVLRGGQNPVGGGSWPANELD